MSKLGMEKVENVDRVTLRRGRNLLYVISNPDCFKAPNSDTYVVFGEAKAEDMAAKAAAQAAAFKAEAANGAAAAAAAGGAPGAGKVASITEEVDEGEYRDMEDEGEMYDVLDPHGFEKMSDAELIDMAEKEGMEEILVTDLDGNLANREEVVAALKNV